MTVKGIRTQEVNLDPDSFGAWLDHHSDDKPYLGTLTDRYPSIGEQIDLCWDIHIKGFDPEDPVGSLRRAIWAAEMDRYCRSDDENWAWNEHDFPEDWTSLYVIYEDAEVEVDEFLIDTLRICAPTLWERISEALPKSQQPEASKKRRIDDRRPRYEQRDSSPRGKVTRSVDKAHNKSLARRERHSTERALQGIAQGWVDSDQVHVSRRGKLPYWDNGTPARSHQA